MINGKANKQTERNAAKTITYLGGLKNDEKEYSWQAVLDILVFHNDLDGYPGWIFDFTCHHAGAVLPVVSGVRE
jgi:hypothetical protein